MTDKRPHFTAPDEKLSHHRWILVAHQSGARIFEGKAGSPLTVVQRIAHTEGHLKSHDIDSDAPGKTHDRMSSSTHSMNAHESAHEHMAETFAKQLCEVVTVGKNQNKYHELVLVAEPKFLGRLKHNLDNTMLKNVSKTIEKDYARTSDAEVIEHLKNLL